MTLRRQPDVIAAARTYLNAWLPIGAEESVVMLASTNTYEPILQAFVGAVMEAGADPMVLIVKDRGPIGAEVPQLVVDACSRADVMIDLQHLNWGYSESRNAVIRAVTARGGRYREFAGLEEDLEHFCELLPDPVVQARTERMARLVNRTKVFRIRSEDGTDLEVRRGDPEARPVFSPQGQGAFSPPEDGVNGTIAYKGGIRVQGPTLIKQMVYQPVHLEVEAGKLVRIGRETEAGIFLDDWLRSMRHPGAYQFAHINFGVDHRVKLHRLDNLSVHFNYGGVLIAFGTNYTARFLPGQGVKLRSHVDMQWVGQSVWADDTQILDRGEFTSGSGITDGN